ncbi:MAG TPA: dolichol-phosphate mannosyltransferase [Alphaproteobacteria bacterium]|nr:dolichol-phosphate mannosyltransferase [Alphaproteobacteria bacterium]HAJ46993.1 dolichol-phosphate mannosyltransferase [Alphaproteobacteria bacterium]
MTVELSVVVPVKDEAGNAVPLLREIVAALRGTVAFEVIFIDDGSSDATVQELLAARVEAPELRVLKHRNNCGQSRAIRTGVMAARGTLVATLDGDGQNDPADIPALLAEWRRRAPASAKPFGMVAGQRRTRQDNFMKRYASKFGNGVRGWLLQDRTRDTGCGLKLFAREAFLRLPYFDHMHRFLPALVLREGYEIAHHDVNHRPRQKGRSKYGTLDRLWVSLSDIQGVYWLTRRARALQGVDET